MCKKKITSIFVSLFFILGLEASIQDYFKQAGEKSDAGRNQIEGIDFIYLINLDQRPQKLEHCLKSLSPYGIHPHRFSAVNGWELSIDAINNLGVPYKLGMPKDLWGTYYLPNTNFQPFHEILQVPGRTYFSHCLSRGAIGIVLSHLSILQDALNSGYETIWVLEDDIEVIQDPHTLTHKINELDSLVGQDGWDILFTDIDTKNQQGKYVPCTDYARRPDFFPKKPDQFNEKRKISKSFTKIGARYGAYSMILRRSGIKKILDFYKKYKIFLPYDMEYIFPDNIQLFSVNDDIVSTLINALSDNGQPGYKRISQ